MCLGDTTVIVLQLRLKLQVMIVAERDRQTSKNKAAVVPRMPVAQSDCLDETTLFFLQITHRDTLSQVTELTGVAIMTRGEYFKPGSAVPPDKRKLYLLIEGSSESAIKKAKTELKKILAETTEKVMRRDAPSGKYSIM